MFRKGYIFDIKRFAVHDGPGIRTTIFLQGCPLGCWWCHNPESRPIAPASYPDSDEQPTWRQVSLSELVREAEKDVLFYDQSGGGVTISGGEPLLQYEFLEAVLKELRHREIHTLVDTTGATIPEIFHTIANLTGGFLYDIKFIDNSLHEKFTGVKNDVILENLLWALHNRVPVTIRIPLIPGITATPDNLMDIGNFLARTGTNGIVELLNFNLMTESKYHRFKMEYKLQQAKPFEAEDMKGFYRILQSVLKNNWEVIYD